MKKSGSGPGIPGESPDFREQIVPQGETRLPRNEALLNKFSGKNF